MEDRRYGSERLPRGPRHDPRYRDFRDNPRRGPDSPRVPQRLAAEDFFESRPVAEERDRFPLSNRWVSEEYKKKQEAETRQPFWRQSMASDVGPETPRSSDIPRWPSTGNAEEDNLLQKESATGQARPDGRGQQLGKDGDAFERRGIEEMTQDINGSLVDPTMDIDSSPTEASKLHAPWAAAGGPCDTTLSTNLNVTTHPLQPDGQGLNTTVPVAFMRSRSNDESLRPSIQSPLFRSPPNNAPMEQSDSTRHTVQEPNTFGITNPVPGPVQPVISPDKSFQQSLGVKIDRDSLSKAFQAFVDGLTQNIVSLSRHDKRHRSIKKDLLTYEKWKIQGADHDNIDPSQEERTKLEKTAEDLQNWISQEQNKSRSIADNLVLVLVSMLSRLDKSDSAAPYDRLEAENRKLKEEVQNLSLVLQNSNAVLNSHKSDLQRLEDKLEEQSAVKSRDDQAQQIKLQSQVQTIESQLLQLSNAFKKTNPEPRLHQVDGTLESISTRLSKSEKHTTDTISDVRDHSKSLEILNAAMSTLERRLVPLEGLLNGEHTEMMEIKNFVQDVVLKSERTDKEAKQEINELRGGFKSLNDIQKSLRSDLSSIKTTLESMQKDHKYWGNEIMTPGVGLRGKLEDLSGQIQAVNQKTLDYEQSIADLRHNHTSTGTDSTVSTIDRDHEVDLRLRIEALDRNLQHCKEKIDDTARSLTNINSESSSQIGRLQVNIQDLASKIAKVREIPVGSDSGTIPRTTIASISIAGQSPQQSWQVENRRYLPTGDSPLNSSDISDLRQKVQALQNLTTTHEERLNNFTIEQFLKSMVHQMRVMYSYPDAMAREIARLRQDGEQNTNSLSDLKTSLRDTIGRIQQDLNNKANAKTTLSLEFGNDLQLRVQELDSNLREQAQALEKVSNEEQRDPQLTASRLEKLEERLDQLKGPQTHVHQGKVDEANGANVTGREDSPASKNRIDELQKKIDNSVADYTKFRNDFLVVLESAREDYDSKIEDISSEAAESHEKLSREIGNLDEQLTNTISDFQGQISALLLRSGMQKVDGNRSSFSPSRRSDNSRNKGSPASTKSSRPNYGSSLLGRQKRKRGHSNSISDSEHDETTS